MTSAVEESITAIDPAYEDTRCRRETPYTQETSLPRWRDSDHKNTADVALEFKVGLNRFGTSVVPHS
ncbi:hypothetical protein EYF80_026083 [Liparis tanakae]|uniref:Uncharacterized protein n=1 Tax=Liparis tanakae TaxID=230148 RepID=A0A4Z2HEF0_9TELE|nr:hypothetical protein EYF80_026083 [Liparis tanakae]